MNCTYKSITGVTAMLLAPLLCGISAAAQNASEPSLADQVKHQYKLTKLGADSNVLEAGTLLVIQTEGILGVPQGSADLCPTIYKDGALRTPSADDKAQCGKNVRKLNTGEKVYVLEIDVDSKKDRVSLLIAECGSCNGATQLASYKSPIIFQFPNGYLAGADAGQIEDVISQFLKIDDGGKDVQQQAQGGQNSPAGLTNEEVIRLVQAKLPDSVVLAKIKSSSCDFDTSTEALIKLKRAGVSDVVLNAIVEAPPPSSNSPDTPESPNPPAPACSDYDACMSAGKTALGSSQWEDAIAVFQAASSLDNKKPDAWAAMGNAYLGEGHKEEAVAMWDKALAAGGPLTFAACHGRAFNACEIGNLVLGPKNVSFVSAGGQQLFSAPPSQINSPNVHNVNIMSTHYVHLSLKAGGKNFTFQIVPFGVSCETKLSLRCPEQGIVEQLTVSNYISQSIPKLASGTLGSSPP
jgi:tetratricopeptide (TPR) repeat protein